ncbi:hypothetical protein N7457_005543 [Penicillium paradoxum]|uniref:uncharacterized protein n=1 Tax=Penicillium paradoxum TaxID=176176 RepID=UPI0025465D82|nr:uncharacterized protein N7457_005543 [Penicillium paradoxum]KAJ5780383.1 hypothetical protein N7457_005543 [Penicillium paradoxum]
MHTATLAKTQPAQALPVPTLAPVFPLSPLHSAPRPRPNCTGDLTTERKKGGWFEAKCQDDNAEGMHGVGLGGGGQVPHQGDRQIKGGA